MEYKRIEVEVLRCKGMKNPIREVCYIKKVGIFRVMAVQQATDKQITEACKIKYEELFPNGSSVSFVIRPASNISSNNQCFRKTFYVEIMHCYKRGNSIEIVSYVNRESRYNVIATIGASDFQVVETIINDVKHRFPEVDCPIIKLCESQQEIRKNESAQEIREDRRSEKKGHSLRSRILEMKLFLQCPVCREQFLTLSEAISHAKVAHAQEKHLIVYLYEAAYENYLQDARIPCSEAIEAKRLLKVTEDKIEKIEEKQKLRESKNYLKYESTSNTWGNIENSTRQTWHWWDPEVKLVYAGRVDSKRSKH